MSTGLTPPPFWWPQPGVRQLASQTLKQMALWPASFLYGRVVAQRMAKPGAPATVPVICVGNFVAGGAGKTPTALALYDVLADLGMTPAFVTRGFGGALATTSFRVDHERHRSDEVGDEPLLLAAKGMTFVGPDRQTSITSAAALGATCVLFDDGLQNPLIAKNLALAVVDGTMGVGNGLCHPAGPLRAPVDAQMAHVDFVVVIGRGHGAQSVVRSAAQRGKPVLSANLEMAIPDHLHGKPIYAFSGIGHPAKFFSRLEEAGLDVVKTRAFPDHHPFSPEDARELTGVARERGALLVTTQKDAVRFAGRTGALGDLDELTTPVNAKLVFEDPGYVRSLLRQAISTWRRQMALVQIS